MNSKNNSKKKKENNFWYYFIKITGAIPTLIWARQKIYRVSDGKVVKNKKIDGRVLIYSNHCSYTDPWLLNCIFWYRHIYFLAATELFSNWFGRWFFTNVKCIPVDRTNFSMATFHSVIDRLRSDKAVLIFPEGQINRDEGAPLGFKTGAVLMATSANAPLLPVYIVKRKWYNRHIVLIGDPIDLKEKFNSPLSKDALYEASEYLRAKETELQEFYNSNIASKSRGD